MKINWISPLALLMLALLGCSLPQAVVGHSPTLPVTGGGPQGNPAQAPSPNPDKNLVELADTPEASDMTSLPLDKDRLVDLAKYDLAGRLKIYPSQITLFKTMEITWPNISAGCNSNPGQILTKGRVYGYRVWLESSGTEYVYHVGETGQVIPCLEPNPGANNPLLMKPSGPTQDSHNNQP